MNDSRRRFLALVGAVPLAVIAAGAAQATPSTCNDPNSLPLSQKNRRRALGYADVSSDAKRRCGLCAFYTAGQNGCGTCQMLSGGPVDPGSVCNSFAPKPS